MPAATTATTPRIAPLEPPYDEAVGAQLERMMPAGTPPIALFRTFARNLPMTAAMHGWGTYELGRHLSVPMRAREIVIDRTCARCGCEYEWAVHVAFFAGRVGFTGDQVRSLVHGGPGDACWTDEGERLLIALVDQLHDGADVDDALWAQLAARYGDAELLDLVLLCGWYHAISFAARAGRVPHEPGTPRFTDVA
jgi:alkylhydroperoxidase family enzyme